MFPFTLAGPAFLLFFAAFAALVAIAYLVVALRAPASGTAPRLGELAAAPYQVAYLRGGTPELVRVAVFNLVDRGLLKAHNESVSRARRESGDYTRQPIDRAILDHCASLCAPESLKSVAAVSKAADAYEDSLRKKGLLLDSAGRSVVASGLVISLALIVGLAGLRLAQAFSRGQSNVFGLLIVTAIAAFVVYRISRVRTSARGREALASLRTLVDRNKVSARLRPGGATHEAVLFAALYGIFALPSMLFDFVPQLYPRPQPSSGSNGDGGGDGGSGCGGGGGCGGCGG
jgi:uncharacterized protein (TIGR04222 family)